MLTKVSVLNPDSPWEAKAVAIVTSIQDSEVYTSCILLMSYSTLGTS